MVRIEVILDDTVEELKAAPKVAEDDAIVRERALSNAEVKRYMDLFEGAVVRGVRNLAEPD